MSDLSKVLGDLYGEGNPDGVPVQRELSASERASTEGDGSSGQVADDLAAVLNEALSSMPGDGDTPPAVAAAEEWEETLDAEEDHLHVKGALKAWQPADDDILPKRGKKGRRRRR